MLQAARSSHVYKSWTLVFHSTLRGNCSMHVLYSQSIAMQEGLRGAVAYGLAVNLPNIDAESDDGIPAIESATLVIVLVSTLLFGGITGDYAHTVA